MAKAQRLPFGGGTPPPFPGGTSNSSLTAREQIDLALLAAGHARRQVLARMRRSRLLHWRYRTRPAEELLIAPPDLRAQDPSFIDEIAAGNFGLAGCVAALGGKSPFSLPPPSIEWARELHGFGWLRHLGADRTRAVEELARRLSREWISRGRRQTAAWEAAVLGRRIISWLSHADLLLEGLQRRPYTAFMRSLCDQVGYLSASWRDAPDGHPRLLGVLALVQADLCIAGRDRKLAPSTRLLTAELDRQILSDGGHISRNPAVLVELMLDLLPLRQCFIARGQKPDPALLAAMARIVTNLHSLRLGDGLLARFNGSGSGDRDALAMVLAYDTPPPIPQAAGHLSGYVRLEGGSTIVVIDAGKPPPLQLAAAAGAGCLSFELSTGSELLFVNAGTLAGGDIKARAAARATANHNTLVLNEQSSSKLIRNPRLERQIGSPPIRRPDHVSCEVHKDDFGVTLDAAHDGYVQRFGLIHHRTLKFDAGGCKLLGLDKLSLAKDASGVAWELPVAVHFHLHPDVEAHIGPTPQMVDLILETGEHWRLSAPEVAVSIEDSRHFADVSGPREAQQVVLRALCRTTAELAWTIERIKETSPMDRETRKAVRAEKRRRHQIEDGQED
jgi:uncharacterized heparinase superfamily protein